MAPALSERMSKVLAWPLTFTTSVNLPSDDDDDDDNGEDDDEDEEDKGRTLVTMKLPSFCFSRNRTHSSIANPSWNQSFRRVESELRDIGGGNRPPAAVAAAAVAAGEDGVDDNDKASGPSCTRSDEGAGEVRVELSSRSELLRLPRRIDLPCLLPIVCKRKGAKKTGKSVGKLRKIQKMESKLDCCFWFVLFYLFVCLFVCCCLLVVTL